MSKRAPRRSDEEWRQIILEARSYGGSDFEYCRSHGILHSTFYRALACLRQHEADAIMEAYLKSGKSLDEVMTFLNP